jgi:hypothetical protein
MGEAKRNLENIRKSLLAEFDKWDFAPTTWETKTIEELNSLPKVIVTRYPDHILKFMRMKPRECHANSRFMQEKDPDGRMKHVTGWLNVDDHYILHSVVDQCGQMVCVTPVQLEQSGTFEFIPDSQIEWRENGNVREAYRQDVLIGPGLRSNPEKTRADLAELRARLLSGMNPYDALHVHGASIAGLLGK